MKKYTKFTRMCLKRWKIILYWHEYVWKAWKSKRSALKCYNKPLKNKILAYNTQIVQPILQH